MRLAGAYAQAGRRWVVERILKLLGTKADLTVHNHHNFAWEEKHFGRTFWVVRKGATPAFPGQQGFVGATMGGTSVILEGLDSPASKQALYSTVHGAGRVMSRRKAAGAPTLQPEAQALGADGARRGGLAGGAKVNSPAGHRATRRRGGRSAGGVQESGSGAGGAHGHGAGYAPAKANWGGHGWRGYVRSVQGLDGEIGAPTKRVSGDQSRERRGWSTA